MLLYQHVTCVHIIIWIYSVVAAKTQEESNFLNTENYYFYFSVNALFWLEVIQLYSCIWIHILTKRPVTGKPGSGLSCQNLWEKNVDVVDVTYLLHRQPNAVILWCTLCSFHNKLKIKLKTRIFTERHTKPGCFKNKWMPNNVFDVLYLNLYAYLHYSYFPGLGTNPIDMEMRELCFVTEMGREKGKERESPRSLLLRLRWQQIWRIYLLCDISCRRLHEPPEVWIRAALFKQQEVVRAGHSSNRIQSKSWLCQTLWTFIVRIIKNGFN